MRVYLATTGSHGDVHPYLGIGQVLQRRGHDVVVFTNAHFRQEVEAAGLTHQEIAAGVDLRGALADARSCSPRRRAQRVLWLLLDAIPTVIAPLRRAIAAARPDVVLAHNLCFGVRWLCEELGIPHALGVVSPQLWLSSKAFVPAPQKRPGRLQEQLGRWAIPVFRALMPFSVDLLFNRLRRRHGFAPQKRAYERDLMGGDRNLGLWSRHFRPTTSEDPPHGTVCGFVWYDQGLAGTTLAPEIQNFLDAGQPPIVFTLGTATATCSPTFFETAVAVCRRLGRRGLLLTGQRETSTTLLSPDVLATRYAPYSLVLPRAAAVVQHAGVGTIALALRAGCPAVVVPQAYDQFCNAVYAVKHGVATWLDYRQVAPEPLTAALVPVLQDAAYRERTRDLGQRIAAGDGALRAAEILEALAVGSTTSPFSG